MILVMIIRRIWNLVWVYLGKKEYLKTVIWLSIRSIWATQYIWSNIYFQFEKSLEITRAKVYNLNKSFLFHNQQEVILINNMYNVIVHLFYLGKRLFYPPQLALSWLWTQVSFSEVEKKKHIKSSKKGFTSNLDWRNPRLFLRKI